MQNTYKGEVIKTEEVCFETRDGRTIQLAQFVVALNANQARTFSVTTENNMYEIARTLTISDIVNVTCEAYGEKNGKILQRVVKITVND